MPAFLCRVLALFLLSPAALHGVTNGWLVKPESEMTLPIVSLAWDARKTKSEFGRCTATRLNDTTLITAAHCFARFPRKAMAQIAIDGKTDVVKNIFVPENTIERREKSEQADTEFAKYVKATRGTTDFDEKKARGLYDARVKANVEVTATDIAFLVVEKGALPALKKAYAFSKTRPTRGSLQAIVGFGQDGFSVEKTGEVRGKGTFEKRAAFTSLLVDSNPPAIYSAGYAREETREPGVGAPAPGDSGAPLVRCNQTDLPKTLAAKDLVAQCATFEIYGVASASRFDDEDATSTGAYTSVESEFVTAFTKACLQCTRKPCIDKF